MATAPRLARAARLVGVGAVAGLLLTLSVPPFGWWPLGIVGVAVLARALEGRAWRGRCVVGGAAGFALYAPGLWWATEFHAVGWAALVLVESALLAAACAAVPRGRVGVLLGLPAALVLAEVVRGRWPFGGLPLAGLDLGQVGGPLLPVARLGGHLLLIGVAAVAGAGLAALSHRRWAAGGAALAAVAVTAVLGVIAPDGRPSGSLSVAAVQGGGVRGLRAVDSDPEGVLAAQLAASAAVPPGTALVVWPEDVVDVDGPLAGSSQERQLSDLAQRLGTTLVAGVVEDVPGGSRFRNAAVVWGPDGAEVDRYDKVHRVPFGEYVPLRGLIGKVADLSVIPKDAVAGKGPAVVDTPAGRLAVVISYEVFFADRARSGVNAGGRLLLVPTNASSYTTSQVPTQELAVARLRAVETGRWVVQAAPTGYSAIVDQRGRVHRRSPLGPRAVEANTVGLRDGRTLAMRLGDWPVAGGSLVALLVVWIRKLES